MTEPNTLSVKPVEHDFHQAMKNTLKKLALDFTELGTLEELAELIGVHPVTVLTWCSIGKVPPKKALFIEKIFGSDNVQAHMLNQSLPVAPIQIPA